MNMAESTQVSTGFSTLNPQPPRGETKINQSQILTGAVKIRHISPEVVQHSEPFTSEIYTIPPTESIYVLTAIVSKVNRKIPIAVTNYRLVFLNSSGIPSYGTTNWQNWQKGPLNIPPSATQFWDSFQLAPPLMPFYNSQTLQYGQAYYTLVRNNLAISQDIYFIEDFNYIQGVGGGGVVTVRHVSIGFRG